MAIIDKEKNDYPSCPLSCPDKMENFNRRRSNDNKKTVPVDPWQCYEREIYKCRLLYIGER